MKFLTLALLGTLIAFQAQADEPTPPATPLEAKVTSFRYVDGNRRAAEICGKVTGLTKGYALVTLLVDYTSSGPGTYTTLVGIDGNFCTAVVSYRGTVKASVAPFVP